MYFYIQYVQKYHFAINIPHSLYWKRPSCNVTRHWTAFCFFAVDTVRQAQKIYIYIFVLGRSAGFA